VLVLKASAWAGGVAATSVSRVPRAFRTDR
jgi:hypothetical protein